MLYQCKKCKGMIDPNILKQKRKGNRITINCPFCNVGYEKQHIDYSGYIRLETGQLINKQPKIRMSKKERLKKRRGLIKNGI